MNFSQRFLVFPTIILFWTLNSEAARVKHSKYKPNSWVPEDDQTDWPSPDQLYFGLGADLEGIIFQDCYFETIKMTFLYYAFFLCGFNLVINNTM